MHYLKITILVIQYVLILETSFSQQELIDSSNVSHFVYIVPTSNFGHMLFDLSNVWVEKGYGYRYKKSMYCFGLSGIVYSEPQSGGGMFAGISNIESNGFGSSVEYKHIFFKAFYSGVQLSYEFIETKRPEKYLDELNQEVTSYYKVHRNEVSLIPRVGFIFLKRNRLSCDVNIGTGIRYIWSTNSGKKFPGANLQQEGLTEKVFDYGQKFAQRLSFQWRIGYAF